MSKKLVYLMFLVIILTGVLVASTNVHRVEAPSTTIYIRADGSIEPFTDLIFTADSITYYFTDSFNASIVVERSSIIIDGDGYTLAGPYTEIGFNLTDLTNVTIRNVNVRGFGYGIYLQSSTLNIISENNITFNEGNIYLGNSFNNTITGNTITDGAEAIQLYASSNNTISCNSMSDNYNGVWSRLNSAENVISENNITENYAGIYLNSSSKNTISENNIADNNEGISVERSSNNTIAGNNITRNSDMGVWVLSNSRYNTMIRNNIDNNYRGIVVQTSHSNTVVGNNITRNSDYGIFLYININNNAFYHNNFLGNTHHAGTYIPSVSVWDNGYPSGGNYWSNYTGVDLDPDGIGDTEHVINENNTDNYPLMGMFSDFQATSENHVQTISNSTVSDFQFNGTATSFNVSGENGTIGFCRVFIPTALMNTTYRVFVNGTEVSYTLLPFSNSTHSYLYLTYNHSTQEVIIIPEFPLSLVILPLFMITTLLVALMYRRRKLTRPSAHTL